MAIDKSGQIEDWFIFCSFLLRHQCFETSLGGRFEKSAFLEFLERLSNLFLRVHDDRAVPGHRLLKWFARNQ